MPPPRVSVIVVSFNTAAKLRRCLECLGDEHEVIVIDNASTDGSAELVRSEFPHVQLIANNGNVGFGAANNQGIDIATGEWTLFLNSDAYAERGAITRLALDVERARAIAGGGMLLNTDGTLQESVAKELTLWRVFLEQSLLEPFYRRWKMGYWETKFRLADAERTKQPVPVAQVMGACLLMRRDCGERFNERFFLYCEDTDLCKRLTKHGEIVYAPSAHFIHELGSSSVENRWLSVARYNRGKELYFELHQGRLASIACLLLNRTGALVRLMGWALVTIVKPSKASQVRLFWRVLTSRKV